MSESTGTPGAPDVSDVSDGPERHGESFYAAIGGEPALRRLIDRFYDRVLTDPVLAPVFVNFTPTHVDHVVVWLSEVFGGPAAYTERLGGHHSLLAAHLHLRITEEQRARWVEVMLATAAEELPADELLRARFAEYVEWGTRIAKSVSQQESSDLGEPGPSPRWGWQGLV